MEYRTLWDGVSVGVILRFYLERVERPGAACGRTRADQFRRHLSAQGGISLKEESEPYPGRKQEETPMTIQDSLAFMAGSAVCHGFMQYSLNAACHSAS